MYAECGRKEAAVILLTSVIILLVRWFFVMTIQKDFDKMRRKVEKVDPPPRMNDESSTEFYRRTYDGSSGIYILRQHCRYAPTVLNLFKIGRAGNISKRFKQYREAQTIVFFIPTNCPRAAEKIAKLLLASRVVYGHETVQADLSLIIEIFTLAVQIVADAGETLGHKHDEHVHRAYDRNLLAWIVAKSQGIDVPHIDSPLDTPVEGKYIDSPLDTHVEGKQRKAKRKAKRKRALGGCITSFVSECCVKDVDAYEHSAGLYARYKVWCTRNGARCESVRWFGLKMGMIFGTSENYIINGRRLKGFRGVRLATLREVKGVRGVRLATLRDEKGMGRGLPIDGPLGGFIQKRCILDRAAFEHSAVLYEPYKVWCARNGEQCRSVRWFGLQMGMIFGTSDNYIIDGRRLKGFRGVRLRSP